MLHYFQQKHLRLLIVLTVIITSLVILKVRDNFWNYTLLTFTESISTNNGERKSKSESKNKQHNAKNEITKECNASDTVKKPKVNDTSASHTLQQDTNSINVEKSGSASIVPTDSAESGSIFKVPPPPDDLSYYINKLTYYLGKIILDISVFAPFFLLLLYYEKVIRNNYLALNNYIENSNTKYDEIPFVSNQIKTVKDLRDTIDNTNIKVDGDSKFILLSSSLIGKSHLQSKDSIPCQDSSKFIYFGKGWGVAVVADGAGSARLSQLGSKFVTENVSKLIHEAYDLNKWDISKRLPSDAEWNELVFTTFSKVRNQLLVFSNSNDTTLSDYASTVIVTLFSPYGLAVGHIGDGRAGYSDSNNDWHPMLTPHKGEEANQTLFLTSDLWINDDLYINGNKVPESIIIRSEDYRAFTLMTDGCEQGCYELGYYDHSREVFVKKNKPYNKFFNPLIDKIKSDILGEKSIDLISSFFQDIVDKGNVKFEEEMDDKTLVIGIRY